MLAGPSGMDRMAELIDITHFPDTPTQQYSCFNVSLPANSFSGDTV